MLATHHIRKNYSLGEELASQLYHSNEKRLREAIRETQLP